MENLPKRFWLIGTRACARRLPPDTPRFRLFENIRKLGVGNVRVFEFLFEEGSSETLGTERLLLGALKSCWNCVFQAAARCLEHTNSLTTFEHAPYYLSYCYRRGRFGIFNVKEEI